MIVFAVQDSKALINVDIRVLNNAILYTSQQSLDTCYKMRPVRNGGASLLPKSLHILEQNEDILATVVENMQIGRLDDCMKQFGLLQSNLISLALELDNYPPSDCDPYDALFSFPDSLMRKDVLDELKPPGSIKLPNPPTIPACIECSLKKVSLLHI